MRKKLFKLSGISAVISAIVFIFNYFFFHYFTDDGFTPIFQQEAGKPFVADLIGQLGLHFLFLSLAALLIAFVCFNKDSKKD